MKSEKQKFQSQYTDKEWAKLCANTKFMTAWELGNLVESGEVANKIIEGDESNIHDARIQKKVKRALGDLME
jgi:hypothetical protein